MELTTAESKQFAGAAMRAKLEAAYAALPPVSEFTAAALAGAAKRHWYTDAGRAIAARYGADAPRFTALLAALSPRVSVAVNVRNATAVFKLWAERGRPTDKVAILATIREGIPGELLRSWINNCVRALSSDAPQLSGPKVDSFMRNLLGDAEEVTIDAWMIAFAGTSARMHNGASGRGPGKTPAYTAMAVKVREAARMLRWSAPQTQAAIWAFTKSAYEGASAAGSTVRALILDDAVTHDIVGAAADFHTLLGVSEARSVEAHTAKVSRAALLRIAARLDDKLTHARETDEEPNF